MLQRATQVLNKYFGYPEFRAHQGQLIERVLAGQDVLGVMPTGAGKSLVYQVPALVQDGLTLVISPLISLMKDQVDSLNQAGIQAACLNSSLTPVQQAAVIKQIEDGSCPILYIAPERLEYPRFTEFCQRTPITLVAVDEAHCISQWGQDFRPSYTRITSFIKALPKRPTVCALTATATEHVREDIAQTLELQNPYACVAGFDRQNLYFGVKRPKPADKLVTLVALVKKHPKQSGIIYCSTRLATEEVYQALQDDGHDVALYHAGLPDATRRRNQEDFLFDRTPLMVATNAFGMGIDKSNVNFVIHYNMPRDLESYYQEAGRAGRDGTPANCMLIYNKKDVQTARFFAEKAHEERLAQGIDRATSEILYERDLERVRIMTTYCTTPDCLRSFILRYFGEREAPFRCEHCSSCEAEHELIDATTDAQKIISCVLRLDQRGRTLGRTMIIDILRGSEAQKITQAGFDTLSTYGIMKESPKPLIHTLFDALLAEGLLQVTDGKYPVIICTQKGAEFLCSQEPLMLKVAKVRLEEEQPEAATAKKRSKRRSSAAEAANINQDLFENLRALRTTLAQEQGVPPYVVFHDSSLIDMCAKRPQNTEEFLEVSGVGQVKAERYAEAFLASISAYFNQDPS